MSNPPQIANVIGPVAQGRTIPVANEAFTVATTKDYYFNTDADAVLVSVYVSSVTGTLDVSLYTLTDLGKELLLQTFPQVVAPTTNLLLKKAANVMSKVKVRVVTSAAATVEVYARGVSAAEASVKILGATNAVASAATVLTTPTVIIPSAITDRSGLVIKNNNGVGGSAIYLGFSAGEANLTTGYPLQAQESLGMDISSGVEVYGISVAGTTDVRLLQSGG